MKRQEEHTYDDIIHLPRHVSSRHPQMSLLNRAAQFSPFAALTGHEAAIHEAARLTDTFVEPDEDKKEQLDEQLQLIREAGACLHKNRFASILVYLHRSHDGCSLLSGV